MANDISKRNNKVYIYVPIIPYYTFLKFLIDLFLVKKTLTRIFKKNNFRKNLPLKIA